MGDSKLKKINVLITGANGFLGRQIFQSLKKISLDPYLLVRRSITNCRCIVADIRKDGKWQDEVARHKFTHVLHLANIATPNNQDLIDTNNRLTGNLLSALEQSRPWLLFASSGAVYGDKPTIRFPIQETETLEPLSDYAQSKADQEMLCRYAKQRKKLAEICIVRISNLIGPKQSTDYFIGHVIQQINLCLAGKAGAIQVGDLNASRDFIDVADAAAAIQKLMLQSIGGVFNLSSANESWLNAVIDQIQKEAKVAFPIQQKKSIPPPLIKQQALSNEAIKATLNWSPAINLQQTLATIIERDIIRNND